MRSPFLVTTTILAFLSCSDDPPSPTSGGTDTTAVTAGAGGATGTSGLSAAATSGGEASGVGGGAAAELALAFAAEVSQAELTQSIADLEAFGTRYTLGSGDEEARDYLVARLSSYGLDAELDPFPVQGVTADNIIARKTGLTTPERVYIFSAHYDSTSNMAPVLAPGADDNASGVAAVLEAARIFQAHAFDSSLWFVFTAAEEQGSAGSLHMADWLQADNVDVRGVIAPDMIGYWPLGDDDAMDILGDDGSVELTELMAAIADELAVPYKKWTNHGFCYGDDHTNFQEAGFPSISPMDCVEAHNLPESGEQTPHYHQTSDTLATLYMPFTTRVAGVIVATFAVLGGPVR